MTWQKTRLAIPPMHGLGWAETHAAVPHAESVDDKHVRVYFTARDGERRSHIAEALLELDGMPRAVEIKREPLLAPGTRGTFDDSGVMTSCLVRNGGFEWLYYQGWSLGVTVPFYVFVGCARRIEGEGNFERISLSPVMGRDAIDPFMCSSPWVLVENDVWRMWYVSNLGWTDGADGRPQYRVHIKYAESDDGIHWKRNGNVCVDFARADEYAISRPCVLRDPDCYRMWYSVRGSAYRIGYAESDDGLTWRRLDEAAGINVSSEGWDSEMIEYACVFDHGGRRHMLYNGNGFGATGIGHAVASGNVG
jgi:hypothetical protein